MKKQLLGVLISLIMVFSSPYKVWGGAIGIGAVSGDYEIKGTETSYQIDPVYLLTLEAINPTDFPHIEMGFGIELQQPSSLPNMAGEFCLTPIFVSMSISAKERITTPYFATRIGYCMFWGDDQFKGTDELKGDLYLGMGAGLRFADRFELEILYAVSKATRKTTLESLEIQYHQKSLSLGYRF